jgi:hypothetical protein
MASFGSWAIALNHLINQDKAKGTDNEEAVVKYENSNHTVGRC